jgi:hypothetical protein
MAFVSLSSALIAVGRPLIKTIFQTLKDNDDDLDARTSSVEASTNKIVFFDGVIYTAATFATATGLIFHRVQSGIDVTDCKVGIFDKGTVTSGTLSIDVQKATSPDFSASVSIFTTQPSLDLSTASSYDESANAALSVSNKVLAEGDYIRIDISSLPTGLGKLIVYLIGEPS